MAERRTLTLSINGQVIIDNTPVYQVREPRMAFDHLILELSMTPHLLKRVPLFVELWDTQCAVEWEWRWDDQDEPEHATGCLHGLTLTYYPQAMLQLVLAMLPASR